MELKEIQQRVQALRDKLGWKDNPGERMTFLAEELGEVAKAVRRIRYDGMTPEHKKELALECADMLYNIAALANHFDIDLEKAMKEKGFLEVKQ